MNTVSIFAAIVAAAGVAQAGDLYLQDFEDGMGYSTSVAEFSDGSRDYFHRTDGSNMSSGVVYNGADGFYFAGQDLDGEGAGLPLELTTSTFSIDGASNLQFAIDLAEDDDGSNQDWDALDSVMIQYSLDGGSWMSIFDVVNDGSTFNSAAFVNGVEITDVFSTFSADLSGLSGSTMAIRLVWNLNAGDEDLAIDNIRISGDVAIVPVPSAMLGGLGMLGLMAGARLRRK